MLYLIDGYNLLFKLFHNEKNIQTQRNLIIEFLQEKSTLLKLKCHLIFDAHHQEDILPHTSNFDSIKVVYTPKGQIADEYILERIFLSKTPSQITVITSDNSLAFQAKNMQAQAKSIDDFLDFLNSKETQKLKDLDKNKEEFIDTKHEIQRLLKIFEEKLKDDDFD